MHSRKRGRWLRPLVVVAVVAGLVLVGRILWPSGTDEPDETVTEAASPNSAVVDGSSRRVSPPVTRAPGATARPSASQPSPQTPAEGAGTLARPESTLPPKPETPERAEEQAVASTTLKPPARTAETETPRTVEQEPAVPAATTPPPRRTDLAGQRLSVARDLIARNQPVEARRRLSDLLASGDLDAAGVASVRTLLTELSDRLVFGPEIVPGDPFTLTYTVQPNDALSRIPRKMGILVDWRFIARINRISDPKRIRPGQRLKLVTGPFHAVVTKQGFRLDLYLGEGPEQVYVRSFPVGLGEYGSTPIGRFIVTPDSKLENPEWVNPRTGERFLPDDPKNPIGEYWLGLTGDEPHLAGVVGYGIHGTIEPESIGKESSMGCVRMKSEDVALVWSVLKSGVSIVEIRP